MALNDAAVLTIGEGNILTAPYIAATPTDLPTDLTVIAAPFEKVGHTSFEDLFSMVAEGGEATVLQTLQNKNLRTIYSPLQESFDFNLQQFDTASLKLYYGSNATVGPKGEVRVPSRGVPTICTFLAVYIDGDNVFAIYAPKAEVYRRDPIAVADTTSLASLPLRVKFLNHGTNDWAYAVTPLGEVEAP